MGRERQKRKNRSGQARIVQRTQPRGAHRRAPRDDLVAAHWDQRATLSQNYRRLGLEVRLRSRAGGIERSAAAAAAATTGRRGATTKTLVGHEVKVRRDPKTGAIVEVLHGDSRRAANPLGDLLAEAEDEEEEEQEEKGRQRDEDIDRQEAEPRGITRELERKAAAAAAVPRAPRKQSRREEEWIGRLVARHGDDFARMALDRRLNPMQQTAADIARRVRKWRAGQSERAPAAAATAVG